MAMRLGAARSGEWAQHFSNASCFAYLMPAWLGSGIACMNVIIASSGPASLCHPPILSTDLQINSHNSSSLLMYCVAMLSLFSMVQTRRLSITRATVLCTMHAVPVPQSALNCCGLRVVRRTQHYLDGVLVTHRQTAQPYPLGVETAGRKAMKYLKGCLPVSYDDCYVAELWADWAAECSALIVCWVVCIRRCVAHVRILCNNILITFSTLVSLWQFL